jgi:glycosyltransferase involved in cell wall biosynthesis
MLTLGIAIPCYKNHLGPLKNLLDSLERQTKKPDKVIISSSSTEIEDVHYKSTDYSFPFTIITSNEKKNAAQNRNCAASHLDTDIISFIDADDVMHYQRLEIIYKCFTSTDCKFLLHSLQLGRRPNTEITYYTDPEFQKDVLYNYAGLRVNHIIYNDPDIIHNSQCSLRKEIFDSIKYNESDSVVAKEDTEFNLRVIDKFKEYCYFIPAKLSYYISNESQLKHN